MAAVAEEGVAVAAEEAAAEVSAVEVEAVGVLVAAAIRVQRLAVLRRLAVPRQGRPIAPAVPQRDPAREHGPVLERDQATPQRAPVREHGPVLEHGRRKGNCNTSWILPGPQREGRERFPQHGPAPAERRLNF